MPTDRLVLPGYSYLAGPVMDMDGSRGPVVFATGVLLSPPSTAVTGFRWDEMTWKQTLLLDREPSFVVSALAPDGERHLIWVDYAPVSERPGPFVRLLMAEVLGDSVGPIDTVAVVHDHTVQYAAAVSARRRWVLANDGLSGTRLFYSDQRRVWGELPVQGSSSNGLSIAALDDTTVLVAMAAIGPISWGIVRGNIWIGGQGPLPDSYAYSPVLRPRPSGGQWLAWGAVEEHLGMVSYRDGAWSEPESLKCAYRTPGKHTTDGAGLSRDDGEYPALAWAAQLSGVDVVCACMPTDTGFTMADELEGSLTDGLPTVGRDANGDVWVAWWRYIRGMYWTHTYTTATTDTPRVVGHGRNRALAWTLSEPAPESWWAVLRARGDDPFEPVARVRAGSGIGMTWADDSPPAGVLRYKVRRESVDRRYEWLSEEATWPVRAMKRGPSLRVASPVWGSVEVQVSDAAEGPLELRVYDVRGRLVREHAALATGSGEDRLTLDFGASPRYLPSGVYFLRARDAQGDQTTAVKFVRLK